MNAGLLKLIKNNGEEVEVSTFPFTIGSFENFCTLSIDDAQVSPIHCQIVVEEGIPYIQDLNSKIGVIVNGDTIEQNINVELEDGDTIQIGEETFTFKQSSELITEEEYTHLNQDYKQILADPETSGSIAQDIIKLLLDKVNQVNSLVYGENTDVLEATLQEVIPELTLTQSSSQVEESAFEQTVTDEDETGEEESVSLTEMMSQKLEEKPKPQTPPSSPSSRMVDIDPSILGGNFSHPEREPVMQKREPVLVLRETKNPYTEIRIASVPFKIGRSSDLCNYVIDRRGMSRSHATILRDENRGVFFIRDNNALNGTFLNGRQLVGSEGTLSIGDRVKFYDYEFEVIQAD